MRLWSAFLIVLASGCSGDPTSVMVTVTLPGGAAAPASMTASVYDRFGAIALDAQIAHPGPGTLIVRDLPDRAQHLRIVVQTPSLLGGTGVDTVPHRQVPAAVALEPNTPDRDGDGVPDDLDDCPDTADRDQASTAGDGVGDACRAIADLSASDAPADGGSTDLSPVVVLFDDEFNGSTLNNWNQTIVGGGVPTVAGGSLNLAVPASANVTVDVSTSQKFDVGTSVHMRVNLTPGQFFDHHTLGYANAAVSSSCGIGESEAAVFRGQDQDRYVETELGGAYTCDLFETNYGAGYRVLDIVRGATSVDFYQDGALIRSEATTLSTSALPIHLSAYTFTSAPSSPILIQVDYVRVTRP